MAKGTHPPGEVPVRRPPAQAGGSPTVLLGAGLVIGAYAMAPAFVGRLTHLRQGAEVVDHVVPGLVVLALVALALWRGSRSVGAMLVSGMVVLLAGLWMAATHLPLLSEAVHHQVSRTTAAYHCSTAVAVLALGAAWVWRYREALREP